MYFKECAICIICANLLIQLWTLCVDFTQNSIGLCVLFSFFDHFISQICSSIIRYEKLNSEENQEFHFNCKSINTCVWNVIIISSENNILIAWIISIFLSTFNFCFFLRLSRLEKCIVIILHLCIMKNISNIHEIFPTKYNETKNELNKSFFSDFKTKQRKSF